ncbi:hypothetical protein NVP1170O_071 [Vibrio phage 1.170.O._10N.261.52.C3]|nr:hypothetical protein NVP1170O_071 [Vibrio phage 1.170.O._10N.261.52.C3]
MSVKFIVKSLYMGDVVYWLSDGEGATPAKQNAYKYSKEELINHSEAAWIKMCKKEKTIVLIPVEVEDE